MESAYVSLVGWSVLPGVITSALHYVYQTVMYPLDSTAKPKAGSPAYNKQRNKIYTFVVLSYLAYTLMETYTGLAPSYYSIFDQTPETYDARGLKSRYKRLSLLYHPDKVEGAEEMFHQVRVAYETLNDPVKRYAYDRFGMEAIQSCDHCITRRDHMYGVLGSTIGFYVGTLMILGLLTLLHKAMFCQFGRYIALLALAVSEGTLIIQSEGTFSHILRILFPGTTIHDQVQILHQIYITLFIAVSQVGPIWWPSQERSIRATCVQTLQGAEAISKQSLRALRDGLEVFGNDESREVVRQRMIKLATEIRLLDDPAHAQAYASARSRVASRSS
ncbi:MAG: hypothetical protein DHS80DRAFT_15573 [Piptocephalis tieghemiana]|nr:MAG: hypothetical protein DHS80DRAFT_15573 [Piptocephalis tieghemiana]